MKQITPIFFLSVCLAAGAFAKDPSAKAVIEGFYKTYLSALSQGKTLRPDLALSKSLRQLIQKDLRVCREKAGTDVCGWGADGDVYFDAQEYDPKLTYESAGASVSEAKPGEVRLKMNLYPSIKNAGTFYQRDIGFHMIRERGRWVVDDISYSSGTARAILQEEIDGFSHPKQKPGQKKEPGPRGPGP